MNHRRTLHLTLAAIGLALLLAPATGLAQNKFQQCSNIQVTVDLNKGPGNWANNVAVLKLLEAGGGWVIASDGDDRGQHLYAQKGQKYRLNFSDGHNRVEVKPSGGGGIKVQSGSQNAIVLVDITGTSGTHPVRFEITGSPAPNAKINGCTGGSLYFDLGG